MPSLYQITQYGAIALEEAHATFLVPARRLKSFFQTKYLRRLCGNIKKRNYGEEIVFEQMLITDNLNRDDLVIIDRQVQGGSLGNRRIDLLGLRKHQRDQYRFLILEIKLGNNTELNWKVGKQLKGYRDGLESDFSVWKECYEQCYQQLRAAGLLEKPSFKAIEIVKPVTGLVVVGRYSGVAQTAIDQLQASHPDIEVEQLSNRLKAR